MIVAFAGGGDLRLSFGDRWGIAVEGPADGVRGVSLFTHVYCDYRAGHQAIVQRGCSPGRLTERRRIF